MTATNQGKFTSTPPFHENTFLLLSTLKSFNENIKKEQLSI